MYLDPRILIVDVNVNDIIVPSTLTDLRVAINIITKVTMLNLNLQASPRETTTALKLVYRSVVLLNFIMEYVIVSINSWEYPTYLLVIHSKTNFNGYPLIL